MLEPWVSTGSHRKALCSITARALSGVVGEELEGTLPVNPAPSVLPLSSHCASFEVRGTFIFAKNERQTQKSTSQALGVGML